MRTVYPALMLSYGKPGPIRDALEGFYELDCFDSVEAILQHPLLEHFKLVLLDMDSLGPEQILAACKKLKDAGDSADIPLVWLASGADSLQYRMEAYEAGCDDYILKEDQHSQQELLVRLDRVLFNKVANDQLKLQLKQANEMAFIAMSDTSDLGVNVQFLLDVHNCDNLDELGMRLFQALNNYGLNCSLQLRGRQQVKNMEANGMSKELESTLLMECRDQGRYVDFGKRSIMNYGDVSLLVKNMPIHDEKKYGAIKDNVFSLLQGAHARIQALDNLASLELESQVVKRLADTLRHMMKNVDESYQTVMRDIAAVVDEMAEGIESTVQFLGMDEFQERAIQGIMEKGIADTGSIFNQGLRIDDGLCHLLERIDAGLAKQGDTSELYKLLALLPSGSDDKLSNGEDKKAKS
ncbi:response regulator [Oceanobacter mangrovi]|uniref:response regulator n=1 Tax=Oceanobacter mangrovi TaxID=2862510 RepID=UPI001C8D9D57|nr:response regulator [Oceanobacter mangrovi]